MKRVTSKIANRDFYVSDQPTKLNVFNNLPVLSKEDVKAIQLNIDKLGSLGICDVLDRKRNGSPIEKSIFEWIQFRKNKPAISAKQEFFDWVAQNFQKKIIEDPLRQNVEPSPNQGGADAQDESRNSCVISEQLGEESPTGSIPSGQNLDLFE